jgi:DNA modification methylase
MIDIKPYSKNAKKHPDKQLKQIANSLKEFGWQQPIVVDKNGVIIVGHGRWFAYQKYPEGIKEPEIKVADLTEEQAKAYRLADNKLNESEWDIDLAIEDLKELSDEMFDLTGFDKDLLIEPDEQDDVIPENPPVIAKLGDIWQLGRHRLMCGDSTKIEDVEKLMDGKKADMVFTDPPYNVDYGVSKNPRHKIRTIENDKQSPEEWKEFCSNLFVIFREFCSGDIYMWGAPGPEGMRMRLWLTEAGCHWSATIIWKKQQLVLTPANYQRMYEPCFYGWFNKSSWQGDRKQTEVWEIDRPMDSKLHPTMKPIELCCRGIENSSPRDGLILDLFLGSGSTLIACEKTNRICYGMEIDPHYCDVIIKRWEDYTGNKANKLN